MTGTLTVYHGSDQWFSTPHADLPRRSSADGHSGGFAFDADLDAVEERFETEHPGADGVVYEMDLPMEHVLDASSRLRGRWLEAATDRSYDLGTTGLTRLLETMRAATRSGESFEWPDWSGKGSSRIVGPGEFDAGLLIEAVDRTFADPAMRTEFLKSIGVRAVKSGTGILVVDYGTMPPMRVRSVFGLGPAGMPEGTAAGMPVSRPSSDVDARLAKGKLASSELDYAWSDVRKAADADLTRAFRTVARIVVNDAYLQPTDPSIQRTSKQNMGFDVRDAIGLAVQRRLRNPEAETVPVDVFEGVRTMVGRYVDDPALTVALDGLGAALETAARTRREAMSAAKAMTDGHAPPAFPNSSSADGTVLGKLAASNNVLAFCHASAAMRTMRSLAAETRTFASRMDLHPVLKKLCVLSGKPDEVDRILFPLVESLGDGRKAGGTVSEAMSSLIASLRGFAATASGLAEHIDPSRAMRMGAVKPPVPPRMVVDAVHGLFGLSQGSPLPIANHPGWTVEQKNGCQLVKKDGKLSNFEDPESGMTVPSVVQSDGRATDVRYENGRQVTTHVTVHDVLSREATETVRSPRMGR